MVPTTAPSASTTMRAAALRGVDPAVRTTVASAQGVPALCNRTISANRSGPTELIGAPTFARSLVHLTGAPRATSIRWPSGPDAHVRSLALAHTYFVARAPSA